MQYFTDSKGHLTEDAVRAAFNYCRVLLLPYNELGYHETDGWYRSKLHNSLSDGLDIDRELVEKAFDKARGLYRHVDDLGKVLDAFCEGLRASAALPERERHPDSLDGEQLDEITDQLSSLKTPNDIML